MRFAITEVRKFHGPSSDTLVVRDTHEEPLTFETKAEARKYVEKLEGQAYWLAHNQYSYDYQVIDLDRHRNSEWFHRQG